MTPDATSPRATPPAVAAARPVIDWLQPIGALEPCGPSLEYDHEYAVLFSRMAPQADAQYGSFVVTREAPNWAEVERDCQRLLLRTKDINLLVWLCRARTRLGQATGLAHVLGMLLQVLQAWPEAVHPQWLIDGMPEPAVRANALAGLVDPEGLLADVCEIVVASSTAMRLTVRDVERAFAVPRLPDAPSPESVSQQLAALRAASQGRAQTPLALLVQAAAYVHAIEDWARAQLSDEAPSLRALSRILDLFCDPAQKVVGQPSLPEPVDLPVHVSESPAMTPNPSQARTRDDVLADIRSAREWFERHEPSSPVAVLLKQAERMVGKRFSQVADSIPLDLLQKWESAEDVEEGRA
ncbi:type VI secretion system protein TssA [Variovorax boronicumulans]|uniref:type VI secretion system protein TssA n=1 Tax=Variovorax boronicumulans TaxID=436515 RepID=UPI001C5614F1